MTRPSAGVKSRERREEGRQKGRSSRKRVERRLGRKERKRGRWVEAISYLPPGAIPHPKKGLGAATEALLLAG